MRSLSFLKLIKTDKKSGGTRTIHLIFNARHHAIGTPYILNQSQFNYFLYLVKQFEDEIDTVIEPLFDMLIKERYVPKKEELAF